MESIQTDWINDTSLSTKTACINKLHLLQRVKIY